LPTTPEGKVLGYKGVQHDYWSSTGNADTIVVQGETNERHQILNEVGATIEVSRRCVDDNKDNHCSFGLHVGSYDYANSWAGHDGRLLVVEFDPEDAVSVPTDCDFQKLRVSKYRVVEDITDTRKELNKVVYEANKPIYGSNEDEVEDYGNEDAWNALCDTYNDEEDLNKLEIRNAIENAHEEGRDPTLGELARIDASLEDDLSCLDVEKIVVELGFSVEDNASKSVSQLKVLPSSVWN